MSLSRYVNTIGLSLFFFLPFGGCETLTSWLDYVSSEDPISCVGPKSLSWTVADLVYGRPAAPFMYSNIVMSLFRYIYVHIYIYMCVYIYVYVYICVYIYLHIHTCIHIYIYMYMYTYIHIYICKYIHLYIYSSVRTTSLLSLSLFICICRWKKIHTFTYIHICHNKNSRNHSRLHVYISLSIFVQLSLGTFISLFRCVCVYILM